ncbi:MAG: hypothetical protein M8467_17945 [Anaerolineae bacterium]|nr:hypothetical protein [Anaerolineae bacterium]
MHDALKEIQSAREAIWLEEPLEVKQLSDRKAARGQAATTLLSATTKLATLITFLNHVRGVARQGGVDLGTMKAVTAPYLAFHANVLAGFYRLAETARIVRLAEGALAVVDDLDGFATLLGELSIYLNRVDYWIDLRVPWAAFGRTFEKELSR